MNYAHVLCQQYYVNSVYQRKRKIQHFHRVTLYLVGVFSSLTLYLGYKTRLMSTETNITDSYIICACAFCFCVLRALCAARRRRRLRLEPLSRALGTER